VSGSYMWLWLCLVMMSGVQLWCDMTFVTCGGGGGGGGV
jgi:hypothetical protein